MSKRFALAALPIAFASVGAQAQMASYCEGRLSANSFFGNITPSGSGSTATYKLQLQNRGGEPIRYTVRFTAPHIMSPQTGSVVATLTGWQQADIPLGTQRFTNPAGTGQLSQADMIRYTTVTCPR